MPPSSSAMKLSHCERIGGEADHHLAVKPVISHCNMSFYFYLLCWSVCRYFCINARIHQCSRCRPSATFDSVFPRTRSRDHVSISGTLCHNIRGAPSFPPASVLLLSSTTANGTSRYTTAFGKVTASLCCVYQ
jgi:hypothetical protein